MNIPSSSVQEQLKSILAHYASLPVVEGAPGIASKQEQAIITRILQEVAWQQLSDAAKQKKRKSTLALLDKWSYEEGTGGIDLSYENSVVALYDCLEEVLGALVEDTPATIRLKGALLVEKFFINEQQEFSKMRHFDLHTWNAIIDHSQQAAGGPSVAVLDTLFKQMYVKWPKRPYKDAL